MYYIEFIEKKEEVPSKVFQEVLKRHCSRWTPDKRSEEEGQIILSIGRTWRLGPRPAYMIIWRITDLGAFERWVHASATPEQLEDDRRFMEVARIVDGGVYENIGDEIV